MKKPLTDELVFVPLGGVGEIGMNMGAYGFGPANRRKWIVVDCGVSFGGPDLPGIELIMANPEFLEENADDVLALILTHSHEDHYGAVLDLWPGFEKPVYATAFTAAMLAAKRAADAIVDEVPVRLMQTGKPFEVGPFTIEAINVAHSIPESCALLITTPVGRVLHTGDWKLDPSPVGSPPTDIERLKRIGADEGAPPLALICDSTNALKDGESPSESIVGDTLAALIAAAPHRVAVTTFASNVGRVISIARAAEKAGRQVVLSGRALHRISGIARELGMLEGIAPFLDQDMYKTLPRDKVVLLCTGSQGEARAAIARIARGEHPAIDLNAGDQVIFSSWAIPGNEREVIDIQNRLIDKGVGRHHPVRWPRAHHRPPAPGRTQAPLRFRQAAGAGARARRSRPPPGPCQARPRPWHRQCRGGPQRRSRTTLPRAHGFPRRSPFGRTLPRWPRALHARGKWGERPQATFVRRSYSR